jgi:phenylalanyl-tRNA synthetase beta chain
MKLPIAWLRDYIDLESASDELAQRFALLGFPVEGIERRPQLSGIVAGRLVRVEKHPNADRLYVCTVDAGARETLTIVTAATNVAADQIVPVATVGAKLVRRDPKSGEVLTLEIGSQAMRGIESQGMLVSANEIGFEEDWFEDGILQLDADLAPGTNVVSYYRLSDDVLEVEVTSNRVDAMSVIGLARELGAALEKPLRTIDLSYDYPHGADETGGALVELESLDCRRFVAQRFSNVTVRTSPFWICVRLALAGQRPINNLVDVSNFVMLEVGQPLHFYDYEKLAGRRLIVRDGLANETITTLDGEVRRIEPVDLVIADEEQAQCLAGLRGARASEVTAATHELLLEAASFTGARIRRMSIAHGLRTDASSRHEKTLPLALGELGAARAAHLLQAEGAKPYRPVVAGLPFETRAPIRVTAAQVHALLGMFVTNEEITWALKGLGFVIARDGETYVATPPAWRDDLKIREDLIEEIGRIVGYDRIAPEQPPVYAHSISSKKYDDERRVSHALAAAGYREAVTFSLQSAQPRERYAAAGVELPGGVIEISNPLSEDQRYLRFSLLPGLLGLIARYQREVPLRLFEIGHVFYETPESVGKMESAAFETAMVAWLYARPKVDEPSWRDSGFLEFKADSLAALRAIAGRDAETVSATHLEFHPGKTATLLIDGVDAAYIGAIDPRLLREYEVASDVYAGFARVHDLAEYRVPRYRAPSRFPAIERDLAVIVAPEIPAVDIEHAVRAGADGVVSDVRVFDEYHGPQVEAGRKSIAVRVVLQRDDATLTDAEADKHVASILASLRERCGARIRE